MFTPFTKYFDLRLRSSKQERFFVSVSKLSQEVFNDTFRFSDDWKIYSRVYMDSKGRGVHRPPLGYFFRDDGHCE